MVGLQGQMRRKLAFVCILEGFHEDDLRRLVGAEADAATGDVVVGEHGRATG